MKSSFLNLNIQDLLKGFVVAGLTAIGTVLLPSLESGLFPDLALLKTAGITGLTAGIAYLLKNLFTNSNDKLLKTEEGKNDPK